MKPETASKSAYYAVIFTSVRSESEDGYTETDRHITELAKREPGFPGIESFSNDEGVNVTISYWKDLQAHQPVERKSCTPASPEGRKRKMV